MRAGLGALLCLSFLGASAACGSQPEVCSEQARTSLFEATLDPWVLSPRFTVTANTTTWVTVTLLPMEYDGLFGHVNGVADLHRIPAGASPKVVSKDGTEDSGDPFTVLQQQGWQMVPVDPGQWQVYTLEHQLGIRVVSCPAGG